MSIPQIFTTSPNSYLPARLVKGKSKGKPYWYICYYQTDPISGIRERHRETLDINRIHCNTARTKKVHDTIEHINSLLPYGYPYHEDFEAIKGNTPINKSLDQIKAIVNANHRIGSITSYDSMASIFRQYLEDHKLISLEIKFFDINKAYDYMKYLTDIRGVSNTTYNNYLTYMNLLWNHLISKKYITENPFNVITRKKKSPKIRRGMSDNEVEIITAAVRKKDPTLMLCILLQYYCFIRPVTELRKLKFNHFNLESGYIKLPGEVTKNTKDAMITIPQLIIDYMIDYGFNNYPGHYLVFGSGGAPHPDKPIGKNTLGQRHKILLDQLHKDGIITNRKGLQLYSWKDTGAMAMINEGYNIIEIKDQMRHSSLEETQKYIKSLLDVNDNIRHNRKVNLLQN